MANVTRGCCWGRGQSGWRGCWHRLEVGDPDRAALSLHGLPPQMLLHSRHWRLTRLVLTSMLWGMYPTCGSTAQYLHPKLLRHPSFPCSVIILPPGKSCFTRVICSHLWFQSLPICSFVSGEALLVLLSTWCLMAPGLVLGFVPTSLCSLLPRCGCRGALAVWDAAALPVLLCPPSICLPVPAARCAISAVPPSSSSSLLPALASSSPSRL